MLASRIGPFEAAAGYLGGGGRTLEDRKVNGQHGIIGGKGLRGTTHNMIGLEDGKCRVVGAFAV